MERKSISQVLDMYIKDAYEFFEDIGHIHEPLQLMMDIGLGYLKLMTTSTDAIMMRISKIKTYQTFLKII
jgi:excinuclease UvrABC ATPase subunit